MKEFSEELLERLEKRSKLFKPTYIKKVKKNRYRWLYEERAWNLVMFELWYETFFENNGLKPIKF